MSETSYPKVCGSELGYAGPKVHIIVLGNDECFQRGRILHELYHILGFPHEQNRSDRDKYVVVNWKNLLPGIELNFRKFKGRYMDVGPYDYYSLMHYSLYAMANDRKVRTLTPTTKNVDESRIGQRKDFSPIDLQKINTFYKCEKKTQPSSKKMYQTTISQKLKSGMNKKMQEPIDGVISVQGNSKLFKK
ncbi:unnamed protein product [Notodromas monacha]|uniref:Metalloendopeptidase n=1 Tax=Notodromas monacha TaxID=399045 RepID=A0A7R9GEV5_9CRUS|nr:unnamed protein product [Notodromas monacha]CAG0918652.1 unnamed protein product [Notodromas monacha]